MTWAVSVRFVGEPWRHPNHRHPSTLPALLRRTDVPAAARAWVARCAGAQVQTVRRLPGASSSAVHSLLLRDGRRFVLRRYVWRKVVDDEPEAPAREVAGMAWARGHDVSAPDVLALDVDGNDVGDGIPAVLMSQLPGRAEPAPDVVRLAELAASIHAVTPVGFGHEYAPWSRDTCTRPPTDATDPGLWDRAIELWHTAEPPAARAFIHRDLHPGNILWRNREVTGVVDWVSACVGPAGVDVATCRGNLVDSAGPESADAFVAAYERCVGSAHHPYWDLASLLEDDYDLGVSPEQVATVETQLAAVVPRLL